MKICRKCKIEKPETEFHKKKDSPDGLRTYCRDCTRNYARNYYEQNQERLIRQQRNYRAANLEKVRERERNYKRIYHWLYEDEVRRQQKAYREKKRALEILRRPIENKETAQ